MPREKSAQLQLLPFQNPLPTRLGETFFKELPQRPGVYVMYGLANNIIYVGKAKNLRVRLATYKRARPHQVSRKVMRLIHVIDEIRYEICETEASALLRENELLRKHRPLFNVVNTSPESYYFIGLREHSDKSLQFRLTTHPEPGAEWEHDSFFGAFKGRGSVREAYQSLLRLIWACQSEAERFEFPQPLIRYRVPYSYEIPLKRGFEPRLLREWASLIRRYLKGTSDGLLRLLTSQLLANPNIPPFQYRGIQEDLERLAQFYDAGPGRNRRMRRELGLVDHLIPQEKIDDFIVMYKARRNQRF